MRQITKEEWDQYDWLDVTTVQDAAKGRRVFLRGILYTDPPSDEFVYIDSRVVDEGEQVWLPAMTSDEEE